MHDPSAPPPRLDRRFEGGCHQLDRRRRFETHLERARPNPLATQPLKNLSGLVKCRYAPPKPAQNDCPNEIRGSDGPITGAGIALTGVGEAPYRAKAVEEALVGSDGSATAIAAAAAHATDGVTVNTDIHADAAYRTAMAAVYTRRAIEAALGRLG